MGIIKLHVFIAGFFLPCAVTFAITGALYTYNIKGDYQLQTASVMLDIPIDPGLSSLEEKTQEILLQNFGGAHLPSGKSGLRKAGTSWQFEWTGSRADFTLEPTAEAGVYKAVYKRTSWHRFFVQLHKAKGGAVFKFLAGALAVGFILMFASGVLLALKNARLRPLLFVSLFLGLASFTAAALLS